MLSPGNLPGSPVPPPRLPPSLRSVATVLSFACSSSAATTRPSDGGQPAHLYLGRAASMSVCNARQVSSVWNCGQLHCSHGWRRFVAECHTFAWPHPGRAQAPGPPGTDSPRASRSVSIPSAGVITPALSVASATGSASTRSIVVRAIPEILNISDLLTPAAWAWRIRTSRVSAMRRYASSSSRARSGEFVMLITLTGLHRSLQVASVSNTTAERAARAEQIRPI